LIHLLARIATDAKTAKLSAAVCGESASDPAFAVVLAGLGFGAVSASIGQVDAVRTALRSVSVDEARLVADAALAGQSAEAAKLNALAVLANLQSD
jgi:phosphotransferase system enzyme I (PtsI)